MDPALLARYPFLPQAATWIAENGPALDELLTERVYAGARARGRERLMRGLEDAALPAPTFDQASPARDILEEILSYVYARILVSALDDVYVVRRYALAEAVRARELLLREEDGAALEACAGALDLAFRASGELFEAHFTEFLRYSVFIKDMPWKLVRQPLRNGVIEMDAERASRLVQEALRRRIEGELPKKLPPEVVQAVEPDVAPIREAARVRKEAYTADGFGKVDLTLLPPCMHHILGQLQRGENAPHNARFAIVTFLNKIGMTSEEIMQLFAQAPDFREDLTRYQVEHITGVSSGTTYSVPGCDNMQTFNMCYADDLCRTKFKDGNPRVRYPGDYYRYLSEAKPHVDAIAAALPLEDPVKLARAAAMNYALLKKLERVASYEWLPRVDKARVLAIVQEKNIPIPVRDGKLAVDDGFGIALLLDSVWMRDALGPVPPTAPTDRAA